MPCAGRSCNSALRRPLKQECAAQAGQPPAAKAASGASKAGSARGSVPAEDFAIGTAQMQRFDPLTAGTVQEMLMLLSVFSFGP